MPTVLSADQSIQNSQNPNLNDTTFTIGAISDDPRKMFKRLKELAQYLQDNLAEQGITHVNIKVVKDYDSMALALKRGTIDMMSETAFTALLLEKEQLAEIVLNRWKDAQSSYSSVIIARNDCRFDLEQNYQGATIVFEDSASTSGFFIPINTLLNQKLAFYRLLTIRDERSTNEINYLFAQSSYSSTDLNTIAWIHRGLVDFGAMSNIDWQNPKIVPDTIRDEFKVVLSTKEFPRSLILLRSDLPNPLKKQVVNVLENAHSDQTAKLALLNYKNTTHFTKLTAEHLSVLADSREQLPQIIELRSIH